MQTSRTLSLTAMDNDTFTDVREATMTFWMKKKSDEIEGKAPDNTKKKKDDKSNIVKRIDNMRIPQQLSVTLQSLGSPLEYKFLTKDLSATGAFVLCSKFNRYPFKIPSTILSVTVEMVEDGSTEITHLNFLAKIARIVEAHGTGATKISGFGVRIVQISNDARAYLEGFIQRNGQPDVNGQSAELIGVALVETSTPPLDSFKDDEDGLPDITDELPRAV